MWVLLSVLVFGVPTEPLSIANLRGKWTLGVKMGPYWPLYFTSYSISWRPWKIVAIGIDGSYSFYKDAESSDYKSKSWSGSVRIQFYKYFRPNSSFSPFISLSPRFRMSYLYEKEWREERTQEYRVSLDPGVEYFFSLFNKQLSLRLETDLVDVSRIYRKYKYSDGKEYSDVYDRVYFYSPTDRWLSTWLCFHF